MSRPIRIRALSVDIGRVMLTNVWDQLGHNLESLKGRNYGR